MTASLIALVPAAGIGARAGAADGRPKQYRALGGEPMLRHAVRALLADPRIAQVRVAVAPGDPWADEALAGLPRTVWRPCGGPTRAETVRAALRDAAADAALADDTWVLVHDAARPGLPADALARLIDACLSRDRGGLLALPVADTVKQAADAPADHARVARTLPREGLWLAQTPQMFRAGELRAALDACAGDPRVTDEASAVELAGAPDRAPLLVRGARANDKLTWPEDFAWFEDRLAARGAPRVR
ncbi:2-C-methyl-D-erythritol 4-phosphate cytidylyltransferase [Castellaniella defragrans 65Phen]|uniref:2-C-methyl-D-erythritol 4-phosphate cytidylyltransferase n=4 Tax=Castellaniella defragrans TaxID=75697 RepID=W8X8Q9_CASD6|nr:2-C-methyl-D-erythritol 4-phosphate cytidylyltransferase [Castellaniella defragrans]MBB6084419.1 2-C-methyl-D-erythritol 4-phosphate cytidylyltransferase [Castellaniella defragrans]CDM23505.1 2-C-methyl-D-erythritol 4-phosphate cytidylyltransferase [Castellaniella defragrans 65Phen]